jgi:hypothetical protein
VNFNYIITKWMNSICVVWTGVVWSEAIKFAKLYESVGLAKTDARASDLGDIIVTRIGSGTQR